MRKCPRCEQETDDWGPPRTVKGREYPRPYCRPCAAAHQRQRRADGYRPPRQRTTEQQTRTSWLRRLRVLGITEAEYLRLVEVQGGRCAICRTDVPWSRSGTWHVDHDHATGRVRGLLCSSCNQGLGRFHDDPALLASAIAYLTGQLALTGGSACAMPPDCSSQRHPSTGDHDGQTLV